MLDQEEVNLFHVDQLDVELERCVGWDGAAHALGLVAQLGWDDQAALVAHAHALHTQVPACEEGEWRLLVGG